MNDYGISELLNRSNDNVYKYWLASDGCPEYYCRQYSKLSGWNDISRCGCVDTDTHCIDDKILYPCPIHKEDSQWFQLNIINKLKTLLLCLSYSNISIPKPLLGMIITNLK
jgi:hypothetical protein